MPSSDHLILCLVLIILGGFSTNGDGFVPTNGSLNSETMMSCLESTLESVLKNIIVLIFSDVSAEEFLWRMTSIAES